MLRLLSSFLNLYFESNEEQILTLKLNEKYLNTIKKALNVDINEECDIKLYFVQS